ncbi:MAG: heme-binding protein [Pseudomonadota bacterium]
MNKFALVGVGAMAVVAVAGGAWVWVSRSVETPAYTVEVADGPFEIRNYPTLVVASVDRDGERGEAVRAAFSPLARYIFARDRDGEKIAMTAPVTQEPSQGGWTVSFIMPAGRTVADLPAPFAAQDISLSEIEPRQMASVRFSGRWTDDRFNEAAGQLAQWLESKNMTPAGPPEFAYYNDPFTPPFLRRNEVLIEIAKES